MRRFYQPIKDASIYEAYAVRNTGLDEILEVGKSDDGIGRIRSLLQFDIPTISASFANGTFPASASFDLELFVARADYLRYGQQVELNFVSRSWVEGTGYFYQNTNVPLSASRTPQGGYTENDGITWQMRQSGSTWTATGSDYYTSPTSSATMSQPVVDLVVDVTSFIRSWVSGTFENDGFVLKFPTFDENDRTNAGNVRFFSRNTHTIYSPQLVAKWTDQQYITGSISASGNPSLLSVQPRNLKPTYKLNEVVRLDFSVRDLYPQRTFDTTFSAWAGNQRLPATTYFSIVDQQSNTAIIPFDNYSLLSCDGSGSYASFRIEGMYPGRYYKVLIQVIDQGYTQIIDNAHLFTVGTVR